MTTATYQIHVFGKAGCDKCRTLNARIDDYLTSEDGRDFERVYHDVDTEDGLVQFCKMECLNPQRIPAFYVAKRDDSGGFMPLPHPAPGGTLPQTGDSLLYSWVGLQTDYSAKGKGVLSPKMIQSVLTWAQSL